MRRHHAVDEERAVLALDDVRLFAFRARKIAGYGFEQVGLGDDAFERAIFVEDHGEAHRRLLELLQHFEDWRRLVNHERLAKDRHRVDWLAVEGLV